MMDVTKLNDMALELAAEALKLALIGGGILGRLYE